MKKIKIALVAMSIGVSSVLFTGCFGSFGLTKAVYNFNKGLGDKLVQEAVFIGMLIIPVYAAAGFVDIWILNTVEFWTGSNPLSMKAGETDTKVVAVGNNKVTITATQNKFSFVSDKGEKAEMVYNTFDNTWYLNANNQTIKLATMEGSEMLVYLPNGKKTLLKGNETSTQLKALVNNSLVALK